MADQITRLDWLLNRIQLLDLTCQESGEGKHLYQEICKPVFQDFRSEYGRCQYGTNSNNCFKLKNVTRSYLKVN